MTDRGLLASKQLCNLSNGVQGFHAAVNLLSSNQAEVFVSHRATSTAPAGQEVLNAKHFQPPSCS